MAPDGADHEVVEHNVIAPDELPLRDLLGADVGSTIATTGSRTASARFE